MAGGGVWDRALFCADLLAKTFAKFNQDNISIVSAGVTFFILLATFPGLGAFVALYGLLADVAQAREHLRTLAVVLPPGVAGFIGDEMVRIAGARADKLSIAFLGGLVLSIWSANGAVKSLCLGMNIAYEERETRGFVKLTLMTLAFTLGALVFFTGMIAGVVGGTSGAALLGPRAGWVVGWAAWPLSLVLAGLTTSLLYRFGPSAPLTPWRWTSWGGAAATTLWLLVSAAFAFYVRTFGHYDRTYGSLGAVIGLMIWLWLSIMLILAGAELDAEIHRRRGEGSKAR